MIIRCVISDIEGTICSINFANRTLYPYFRNYFADFVRRNSPQAEMKSILQEAADSIRQEGGIAINEEYIIMHLEKWIKEDRKHPVLKKLQALVLRYAYMSGAIKGHVFQDVPQVWKHWQEKDIKLGIYSSMGIEAQKLLLSRSEQGNLEHFISFYFDTSLGTKQSPESYRYICLKTGFPANEILYLSDNEPELDAARAAGLHTCQLLREGHRPGLRHPVAKNFSEVQF